MTIPEQIEAYIDGHPEKKRAELDALHRLILSASPDCKLWFLDGKNSDGKVVSNPNIGYGARQMKYADGTTREFYKVGISPNTSGISLYVMGLDDKTYLARTFGDKIGKASVSGYCIKFRTLKDLNPDVLDEVIRFGLGT